MNKDDVTARRVRLGLAGEARALSGATRFEPGPILPIGPAPDNPAPQTRTAGRPARQRPTSGRLKQLVPLILLFSLAAACAALLLHALALPELAYQTAGLQREVQTAMAESLRAIRAAEPAALAGLCALTFTYGLLHAIGPGHGKLLLGATAVSSGVSLWTVSLLTLASSLCQSLVAVIVVGLGIGLFETTSRSLTDAADQLLLPVSYAAIAMIGLVLIFRGIRAAWQARSYGCGQPTHLVSQEDAVCSCGHRHGPRPDEIAGLTSLREMAWIVASIAIRPCTGALFLLLISWRLGILPAGILATFAMGAGTAAFNLVVSASGVGLRNLIRRVGGGWRFAAYLSPFAQVTAGLIVATASLVGLTALL